MFQLITKGVVRSQLQGKLGYKYQIASLVYLVAEK